MGESRAPKPEHRLPEGEGSFYYAASSNQWVGAFEVPNDTGKRQRVAVSSRDEDTAWAKLQAKRERFPLPPNDSTTEGRPRHQYEKDSGPVSTTMYADTLKRLETQEGRCYYCRRALVDGWVMDHK